MFVRPEIWLQSVVHGGGGDGDSTVWPMQAEKKAALRAEFGERS